MRKTNIPLNI